MLHILVHSLHIACPCMRVAADYLTNLKGAYGATQEQANITVFKHSKNESHTTHTCVTSTRQWTTRTGRTCPGLEPHRFLWKVGWMLHILVHVLQIACPCMRVAADY